MTDLSGKGLASSLDFFGEQVSDPEVARVAADGYLELARAVRELNADVHVSIDLSHVGLDISADFCRAQIGADHQGAGDGHPPSEPATEPG